jgi:hypothetical protein
MPPRSRVPVKDCQTTSVVPELIVARVSLGNSGAMIVLKYLTGSRWNS